MNHTKKQNKKNSRSHWVLRLTWRDFNHNMQVTICNSQPPVFRQSAWSYPVCHTLWTVTQGKARFSDCPPLDWVYRESQYASLHERKHIHRPLSFWMSLYSGPATYGWLIKVTVLAHSPAKQSKGLQDEKLGVIFYTLTACRSGSQWIV